MSNDNNNDRDNLLLESDHVQKGLDLLLGQFQESTSIKEINRILLEQVQEAEDTMFDLFVSRVLELATGDSLDMYGQVVGERRGSLDDKTYRAFIRARILSNFAQGDIDKIITIVRIYVDARRVDYFPMYPRAYSLTYEVDVEASEDSRQRIRDRIELISPCGVGVRVQEALTDTTMRFGDPSLGWGSSEFSRHIKKYDDDE